MHHRQVRPYLEASGGSQANQWRDLASSAIAFNLVEMAAEQDDGGGNADGNRGQDDRLRDGRQAADGAVVLRQVESCGGKRPKGKEAERLAQAFVAQPAIFDKWGEVHARHISAQPKPSAGQLGCSWSWKSSSAQKWHNTLEAARLLLCNNASERCLTDEGA